VARTAVNPVAIVHDALHDAPADRRPPLLSIHARKDGDVIVF
jgi:hypothetical protein